MWLLPPSSPTRKTHSTPSLHLRPRSCKIARLTECSNLLLSPRNLSLTFLCFCRHRGHKWDLAHTWRWKKFEDPKSQEVGASGVRGLVEIVGLESPCRPYLLFHLLLVIWVYGVTALVFWNPFSGEIIPSTEIPGLNLNREREEGQLRLQRISQAWR